MSREPRFFIVCPSCGDSYEEQESVERLLQNSGYCINLTCLADLNGFPIYAFPRCHAWEGERRESA